jgi:phosphatidylglycerophosphate synthase
VTLASVRDLARKRPEQEFFLNRLYGAHLSPFATVVCLRLGLGPDQVTILGAGFGAAAVVLLFLPLGWWSLLAGLALQIGYLLDFSDGQVARLTGRTSLAGAYLDWLTHFYIPVGAALATAASVAWSTGSFPVLVLGVLAALELSAFAFSGKEHLLVAMARGKPHLAASAAFHAALLDDATPADVLAAPAGPADPSMLGSGISGRRAAPSLRSIVGELLIYPGAAHLLTLAVVADVLLAGLSLPPFRGLVLAGWAILLIVHVPASVRRNHALIRAVEARDRAASAGSDG